VRLHSQENNVHRVGEQAKYTTQELSGLGDDRRAGPMAGDWRRSAWDVCESPQLIAVLNVAKTRR